MEKRKLLFDCDNTMGIPDCDIDDGLCLLFLLGRKDIELLGVSSSFGNNKTAVVYENTKKMLKERGREELPLWYGADAPRQWENEASRKILETVKRYPGELDILVTGSTTNIAGAYMLDAAFFSYVKGIYFMGGITEPLIFAKKEMKELNYSIDYKATELVLKNGKNLHTLTGNACLAFLLSYEECQRRLEKSSLGQYILGKAKDWMHYNDRVYGIPGFYNWDMTTLLYYFYPELFEDSLHWIRLMDTDLQEGYLIEGNEGEGNQIHLPKLKDSKAFVEKMFEGLA